MKIALLFGLFPEDNIYNISRNSKKNMQYAANTLQWSFVKGIEKFFTDVKIFNFPFIGSFPRFYKKQIYSPNKKRETTFGKIQIIDNSFINLPIIKHFDIYFKTLKSLKNWAKNSSEQKVIIIYSLNTQFISAAALIKSKYSNVKICLIVPDLPDGMSDKKSLIYNKLKDVYHSYASKFYPKIDYFIFLSKYMREYFNFSNIKYEVIEGIYDTKDEIYINDKEKFCENKHKIVMYCGTLDERYGVLNLVKSFCLLKNNNYRLVICGGGDTSSLIQKYSINDSRISFLGRLSHQEVIKRISTATLLVNPRTPEGKYTKYSFPSKTMEYLASGVPTLLYKLKGIPEEYFEHCFTLTNFEGINTLSSKIEEILEMEPNRLKEIGTKARSFILNKKNPKSQCLKIYKMLSN